MDHHQMETDSMLRHGTRESFPTYTSCTMDTGTTTNLKPAKQEHPWHAVGRFAKHVISGAQSHVKWWKKEQNRKKIESHLRIVQHARHVRRLEGTQTPTHLSEIAMTLISPLGSFVCERKLGSPHDENDEQRQDIETAGPVMEADAVTLDESFDDDTDDDDVDYCLADESDHEFPRLVSIDMMRQLRQAMPTSTQLKVWRRLYSVARDGDAFKSFLNTVAGHRQTLLVIQTLSGELFGGFSDAHWGKLAMRTDGSYYGTGQSFLFSIDVLLSDVFIHPWQGVNEYSILCSSKDGGRLAMGGGGSDASFGFCVQEHFTKGTSGPCATFGNLEPLSPSTHFEIANFEAYGFINNW